MTGNSPPSLGTHIVDEEFNILAACPETTAWARRLGHDAVIGENLFVVFKSLLHPQAREEYLGVLQSQTAHVSIQTTDVNGKKVVTETRKIPMFNRQGGVQILTLVQNITSQTELDRKLRQTQKLESLSVLSGGVAHDFNNLLGGIFGNLNLARRFAADSSSRVVMYIDRALSTFNRARDLTHELMTFADGGAPRKNTIHLRPLCDNAVARVFAGSDILCSVDLPASLSRVWADANQILQVFINLLTNALEAMPEGGNVRITGENCEIDGRERLELTPGRYVKVSVWDDGPQIDPEILDRVFDPFFTTRGSSTGMGLATVHSIITQHEGTISVRSAGDSGTKVSFFLRAASDDAVSDEE